MRYRSLEMGSGNYSKYSVKSDNDKDGAVA